MLFRALAIRRAIEEWKLASGYADQIIDYGILGRRDYFSILTDPKQDSYASIVDNIFSSKIQVIFFSWEINLENRLTPTITGIRTSHPAWLNDGSGATDQGINASTHYILDNTRESHTLGSWVQSEAKYDDVVASRILSRLNMYTSRVGGQKSYPSGMTFGYYTTRFTTGLLASLLYDNNWTTVIPVYTDIFKKSK